MARPRKSQPLKEKLVEAGLAAILRQGYHGTGLKEVLDRVGVPKGSFYNYFQSKDDFVAQVIALFSQRLLALWDGFFESYEGEVLEGIRRVYSALIMGLEKSGCSDGCLIGNLAAELGSSRALLRKAMLREINEWRKRMVAALRKGQERGEVRTDRTPDELADFFWDAWEGSLLRMQVERSSEPLKRTLSFLVDDFLPPREKKAPQKKKQSGATKTKRGKRAKAPRS